MTQMNKTRQLSCPIAPKKAAKSAGGNKPNKFRGFVQKHLQVLFRTKENRQADRWSDFCVPLLRDKKIKI